LTAADSISTNAPCSSDSELVCVRRLRPRVLREAAAGRHAEHRQVGAELRLPAPARHAGVAALDRIDRDPVALGQSVGAGELAHLGHPARELVTQDQRPLSIGGPDRALAVVVLDVGAAESAGRNLDEHLVVGDLGLGDVLDPQVVRLVEDCCSHRCLLSS
jgi:hypothetical protein